MSDFYKIIRHLIANESPNFSKNLLTTAKVTACLAKSPKLHEVPTIDSVQKCDSEVQKSSCLKSVFKIFSACLNASLKT